MLTLKKSSLTGAEQRFSDMVDDIQSSVEELTSMDPALASSVLAIEKLGDVDLVNVNTAMSDLDEVIRAGFSTIELEDMDPMEYEFRATIAAESAILAMDPTAAIQQELIPSAESSGNRSIGALDSSITVRSLARECYEPRNTTSMVGCTCSYNMRATAPDEFVRTVAPLFMINAGDAGIRCVANLLYIQDDAMHEVHGNLIDFNKRSLTRASIDSSILSGSSNKIVPVYRDPGNIDHFMLAANIVPHSVITHGETVLTNPLAIDKAVDLIGISQLNSDLIHGKADLSDQLDAGVTLGALYIGMGAYDEATGIYAGGVLKFNTSAWDTAQFKNVAAGKCIEQALVFNTDSIRINKDTVLTDGASISTISSAIVDDELTVGITMRASGTVNIANGDCVVYGNEFKVNGIYDVNGDELPLDVAPQIAIVDALEMGRGGCRIAGYDIIANPTNLNHRRRGDMVGSECYVEELFVPLLPPITCVKPIGTTNSSEQVSNLVQMLHIRMNNDIVDMLLNTSDILEDYVMNGIPDVRPDILGIGRLFVTPTFIKRPLDVAAEVMGLSSSEREEDVKAVLVMAVRDVTLRLYIDSGLEAARTGLNNGVRTKPTAVIATDSRTASYLYESGDDRLLGDMFNYKIVTSPNQDMIGKIFIFFNEASSGTGTPSCTTFAATAYSSEVVFNLDIPRNGGISTELGVYPRYRSFVVCPILGRIDVSNISDALGRVCNQSGCTP